MIPFVIACANSTSGPTSANANTEAEPNTGADAPTCTDSLQNQNETGVDCGGPCNPCSVLATGQFTHPGALDSQQELDFVKAQIEAGAEPWKSEYDRLVNSTPARWRPHGLSEIDSQGADANTSRDDANAAYAQALLWYYSGDETYAKRSIAILNAWADLQGFTAGSDQDKLQAGWIGAIFAPAAEIMRAYPGWAAEDVEKLQAMFRRAFYPQLDRASSWNGNVDLTQIDAMMAIAVFNEDIELFNAGIERWQKRTHSYFYLESDGEVPAISGDGNNVQSFWSKPTAWVDGLTQETCRDNGHHAQFAIGSAIHAAEVAWHQGVDLYTGESERYTATLELMATQLLTGDMQGTCADNTASKSLFDTWEVAYNHYHNRMGIDLPQTRALIETKIRPNAPRAVWNLAYETLTHAGF
ncbi:MAG: hypothetical protein HOI20_17935 [Gemmatimonadetes bacterium]|nr:hypothetical protein [Gemmatimonadota bacterium]